MNKIHIPSLRFSDYSDEWELKTLSDVVERITRKNTELQSTLPLTISSQYGLVDQNTFFNKRIASQNLSNYYLVKNGEFAYNKSSSDGHPFGAVKRLDLYEMGVLSTLYIVFALKENANINSDYLAAYFDTTNWYKQVSERAAEGARNHGLLNISADDFLDITLMVPRNIHEQELIGGYLAKLEELLSLQSQKYEKLTQVRLSLLDRLIIHDDCSTSPKIRFEGFNGEWSQRTLQSIVAPYTDYLPTPIDGYTRLGIRSHMKGTFYEYVAPSKKLGEKRLQRVKRDNFIVNIVFAWEHAIAVTTKEDEGKLVSHRFPQFSFNSGMHPRFFHYALNDERFRHHLWLASPSGAGRNKTLRIDEMMEYEMRVPEYDEQKKIADFLTSLDGLIDLYETRIKKLQNIKAACLQGMFV